MSHYDYVNNLCRDSLQGLVDIAQARIKQLNDADKIEVLVVHDDFMNIGFFARDDIDGALKCLSEEAKTSLRQKGDSLQIQVQRWFEDEVKDLIKEKT